MSAISEFRGQPAIDLQTSDGARATILLHGAHVVSWVPAGGTDRLYLSPTSAYGDGVAVRGGVPIIFPQFNQRGPDFNVPRHGFARTRSWRLVRERTVVDSPSASATFRLDDGVDTRELWPHPFSLLFTVTLESRRLALALEVSNTGSASLAFTAALHTYLDVGDIGQAQVEGLTGVRLLDTVTDESGSGADSALRFAGETDRIYFDLPRPLTLQSPNGALEVSMHGFRDAVIWNPWAERGAALPDMPDDDYRRMLCIEAAAVGRPVTLSPDEKWLGRQTLFAPQN